MSEPRYTVDGNIIYFHRTKTRVHTSFVYTYENMSIPQARRKMKKFHTHSQQDEMIHYLKINGHIK